MKIAIFTLPLINNYGGILQAYAMQEALKSFGYEAKIFRLKNRRKYISMAFCKFLAAKIIKFKKYKNIKFQPVYLADTAKFISNNLNLTDDILELSNFNNVLEKEQFDAIVLGSDQVLRPRYWAFDDYETCLLQCDDKFKKIIYAGSFGSKQAENLEKLKSVFDKFKVVSVREKSGVELCKKHFGVEAKWVLDPTLLADKQIYEKFLCETKAENKIFAYILDSNEKTSQILREVSKRENLGVCEVNDKANRISIEKWISSIAKAKFVITDSFHGCVFSIIFNKPFFAFVNEARGNARLESLFEMFELSGRIINSSGDINLDKKIDYERVNQILLEQKEFSKNFIISNLEK
ncbi:polysaccharide pyruvyl transferase family protein [Campylobacter sp. VBCF_03 NA9]|uniref:polysaccharide pyruvyl transferase family protein n=1 Tax=Campylobacter sp. VBCF_03 NA9 TaxID=2983839 RepID=UPI0022E9B6BF|nr:polysaccharide pyruvyl transferase family protein [Campylobacter sp. VBCF_03 NA9]MDA3071264.1 polysaccharide pyruvyl transferase family protein [Campylobacter sp. VBCF_03 NA9]